LLDILFLGIALLVCLVLVPFGLPGTWLMIGVALLYGPLSGASGIGALTLGGAFLMAVIGELAELKLSLRYTSKYGGSKRAGWGAIIGGIIGAVMGLPVPWIGSVLGAFAGAFLGALAAELSIGSSSGDATRAARGALLGRLLGTAIKCAIGIIMAFWILIAA
jgi:uncharacterized protein YqgC (DUF456 family)